MNFRFLAAFPSTIFGALIILTSCQDAKDEAAVAPDPYATPTEQLTGVPALTGQLARTKLTMNSVLQVDLDRNIARLPLFRGSYRGSAVWFVRTDVSDASLATQLGLNFAPRLANASVGCATCIQTVQSVDPVPGRAPVQFSGTVDFSPEWLLTPSATGYPPLAAQPGAVAGTGYSDLVQVQGSAVVFNAPIVAVGTGPFDVSPSHRNTHDRVMAIDTLAMTVDLQFVRAFAFGKDIFYFTFGVTGTGPATMERGTLLPAAAAPPASPDYESSARSNIFSFVNGKRGQNDPRAQGLSHAVLDNPAGALSLQNPTLLESLRQLGDAHNVLAAFPTLTDKAQRESYSPLWDIHLAAWSPAVVSSNKNLVQTDANTILQLANRGLITNPDGSKLSSAGFVANCPVLGFATTAPAENQAPTVQ